MTKKQIPGDRSPQAQAWIDAELREQRDRHAAIQQAMNVDLAPQRDVWVAEFLGRVQKRGTNVHGDILYVVPKDNVPRKPARPFKVTF
jgi:hypothetical protein